MTDKGSMAYSEWIAAYVARHNGFVRGLCQDAVTEMRLAFPELRKASGFAHTAWGEDQHVWCVTPDGLIVDPTAAQYPFVDYEELDLNNADDVARIPTGRCMECGGPYYKGRSYTCSDACEASLAESYSLP